MTLYIKEKMKFSGEVNGKFTILELPSINRRDANYSLASSSTISPKEIGFTNRLGIFEDTHKRPVFETYEDSNGNTWIRFIGNDELPTDESDKPELSPYHKQPPIPEPTKVSSKKKSSTKKNDVSKQNTKKKKKNLFKYLDNAGIDFNAKLIYPETKNVENVFLNFFELSKYGIIKKGGFIFLVYNDNNIPTLKCDMLICDVRLDIINKIENKFISSNEKLKHEMKLIPIASELYVIVSKLINDINVSSDNKEQLDTIEISSIVKNMNKLNNSLNSTIVSIAIVKIRNYLNELNEYNVELNEIDNALDIFRIRNKLDSELALPLVKKYNNVNKITETLITNIKHELNAISDEVYSSNYSLVKLDDSNILNKYNIPNNKLDDGSIDNKNKQLNNELQILAKLRQREDCITKYYSDMHVLIAKTLLVSDIQLYIKYNELINKRSTIRGYKKIIPGMSISEKEAITKKNNELKFDANKKIITKILMDTSKHENENYDEVKMIIDDILMDTNKKIYKDNEIIKMIIDDMLISTEKQNKINTKKTKTLIEEITLYIGKQEYIDSDEIELLINKILIHTNKQKYISNENIKTFEKTAKKIDRNIKSILNKTVNNYTNKIKSIYTPIYYNANTKTGKTITLNNALKSIQICTFQELYKLLLNDPLPLNEKYMNKLIENENVINSDISFTDIRLQAEKYNKSVFSIIQIIINDISNNMSMQIVKYANDTKKLPSWKPTDDTHFYTQNKNYSETIKSKYNKILSIPPYIKKRIKRQVEVAKFTGEI